MTEQKEGNFNRICSYLPAHISDILKNIPKEKISNLCEVRIRAQKPVALVFTTGICHITSSGRLTEIASNSLLTVSSQEVAEIFNSMCRYSVHSLTDCISQGFVTLEGGCRAGVCGRAVTEKGRITALRNVSGINIRLRGEYPDIAKPVIDRTGTNSNILICGPPACGKTTFLLDLCRILSDEYSLKVCLVDERGESEGSRTGINTDVLLGYPKAAGTEIAVRTLSPDVIAFDEIGSDNEAEAIRQGINCGVRFITTIHCGDKHELVLRPQFKTLFDAGGVDYCVFLKKAGEISEIISAKELRNENTFSHGAGTCLRAYGTVHSLPTAYACAPASKGAVNDFIG